jgi:hypothetical protein
MKTPSQIFRKNERPYKGLPELSYPIHDLTVNLWNSTLRQYWKTRLAPQPNHHPVSDPRESLQEQPIHGKGWI